MTKKYFAATVAVVVLAISLISAVIAFCLSPHRFGRSAEQDRRLVAAIFLEKLDDKQQVLAQHYRNLFWASGDFFYAGTDPKGFPGGNNVAMAFGYSVRRYAQSLLVSGVSPFGTAIDMSVTVPPESVSKSTPWESVRLREIDLLFPKPASLFSGREDGLGSVRTIRQDDRFNLSIPLSNDDFPALDVRVRCYNYFSYLEADGRSEAHVQSTILYDNIDPWLKNDQVLLGKIAAAASHCFLISLGLPAPKSVDEMMAIFSATKSVLSCIRKPEIRALTEGDRIKSCAL